MVFPEKGIFISEKFSIQYPTFASLFLEKKAEKTDISNIIALADAEDKATENVNDTIEVAKIELRDSTVKLITSIQYKNTNK
ncbi:MAG: hypothetical protein K0S26_1162, partial [Bacteroidota bacterium]|nr:hypothetical protein [Bacteroidota bacterium]